MPPLRNRSCLALAAAMVLIASCAARAGARGKPAPLPAPPAERAEGRRVALEPDLAGVLGAQGDVRMEVTARPSEGWLALARRCLADAHSWRQLADANRAHGAAAADASGPVAGHAYVVPPPLWRAGDGERVLRALFPADARVDAGWRHQVRETGETKEGLARLFCGLPSLPHDVQLPRHGRIHPGDPVTIPDADLLPWLRRPTAPTVTASRPTASPVKAASEARAHVDRLEPGPRTTTRGPASRAHATAQHEPAASAQAAANGTPRRPGSLFGPPRDEPSEPSSPAPSPRSNSGRALAAGPASGAAEGHLEPPTDEEAETPDAAEPQAAAPARQGTNTLETDVGGESDVPEARPLPPSSDHYVVRSGSRSDDGLLLYRQSADGPVGLYTLKAGDTLYTDVVMRFTGLLGGRDVNDAAVRYARRSGVADVTQMTVGEAVEIPFVDLLPPYLPQDHPRRVAWKRARAESERLAHVEPRSGLAGVHVILDPGHGGSDPGAGNDRVWEDDYVYDVACRLMRALSERTLAVVHPLVRDESSAWAPLSLIHRDTDEQLLTTPPYEMDSTLPSAVPVTLRWLLANDIRRRLLLAGVPDDRIVFLSLHADSLHPAARGTMAYFPSAALRPGDQGVPSLPIYQRFAEARPENGFHMSPQAAQRAEGLSRHLGECLVRSVARAGLPVDGFDAVRGEVVRGHAWVPAVLRCNRAGAAVLVETLNLNNPADATNLRDPAFRESLANALAAGLTTFFSASSVGTGP